ncbi:MAG: hypothetical protein Q9202_003301 [Teloschistes flavicans]
MPGVKRKSDTVQLSSSKLAKKQKQSQPASSFKSAEYVVDSDSSGESPHGRPTAKKSATSLAENPSRVSSVQASTARRPTHPKPTVPRSNQAKNRKYESPVESSTSSDDSESTDGTGSEAEESEASEHQARKGKELTQPAQDSQSSDEDEDEDEDESVSDGSDESLDKLRDRRQQQHMAEALIPRSLRISKNSSKTYEPAGSYDPPSGFEAAIITTPASTLTSKIFTAEHLRGKEVWHITVPASVPIDSIKEVPIAKVLGGGPILSYKGADYGLVPEDEADHIEKMLLVPSQNDNEYRSTSSGITKTLQIQQIFGLPPLPHKLTGASNGTVRAPISHVKAVRQQPEGLKMRYRPFGDESSSDNSDATPRFKVPPIVSPARTSKKPGAVRTDTRTSSPHKGAKQKSKESIPTEPRSDSSSVLDLAWRSSFGPSSRATPDQPKSQTHGNLPSNNKAHETSEEKAKRRAEKKKQRREEDKAADTKDSAKSMETSKISSEKKQRRKTNPSPINGVLDPSSSGSVPGQSGSKETAPKSDVAVPEAVVAAHGVDNGESKPFEPQEAKPKRRKRKTEATEDI